MWAVARDVRAQHLHVFAGRLEPGRRGRYPYQPTARLQYLVGTDLDFAADRVEHHVAIGDGFREILLTVVDYPVGAEAADIIVVACAGRRDDRCADVFGQLKGKAGNSARAALDQNGFARFDFGSVFERPQRGQAGQCHRCRLRMAEPVRFLGDDCRLDSDLLCVGALDPLVAYSEYRIARSQIRDSGADCANHAREVTPQNMRELDAAAAAIGAATEPHLVIRRIDARRMNVDDDLARPGDRIRHLDQVQYLRSAMLLEHDRLHAFFSPAIAAAETR